MSGLLNEFEEEYLPVDDKEDPKNIQHNEQGLSTQKTSQKHGKFIVL